MTDRRRPRVPARDGAHALLPLYDPFTRLLGVRDAHWRLVAQAGIEPGATVLEIGCGTGNLLLLAAHAVPGATLIGLDPDPAVLAVAGRKARRAGVTLRLDRGYADRLPYPDGSVDRVLSAFMLHHLPRTSSATRCARCDRVLAPGGRLHLLDIDGSPPSRAGRLLRVATSTAPSRTGTSTGTGTGTATGRARTRTPTPDTALAALRDAGLTDAAVVAHGAMPLGGYSYYRASR